MQKIEVQPSMAESEAAQALAGLTRVVLAFKTNRKSKKDNSLKKARHTISKNGGRKGILSKRKKEADDEKRIPKHIKADIYRVKRLRVKFKQELLKKEAEKDAMKILLKSAKKRIKSETFAERMKKKRARNRVLASESRKRKQARMKFLLDKSLRQDKEELDAAEFLYKLESQLEKCENKCSCCIDVNDIVKIEDTLTDSDTSDDDSSCI